MGEREGLVKDLRTLATHYPGDYAGHTILVEAADALATAEAQVEELTRERELYKRQLDRTDEELPPWEGETDPPVAVGRVQTIRNLLRDRRQLEVYREALWRIANGHNPARQIADSALSTTDPREKP